MAIIPTWRISKPTAELRAELAARLARLDGHRRNAGDALRSLETFLAAHPELRKLLPGAVARGDLTRPRLVINNNENRQAGERSEQQRPLHSARRQHPPLGDGDDAS